MRTHAPPPRTHAPRGHPTPPCVKNDKFYVYSLVIFSLFWKVGKNLDASNVTNIAAVLFMWTTLPAFGAASYVPAIVLERALFVR